jgi:hypothetical protein
MVECGANHTVGPGIHTDCLQLIFAERPMGFATYDALIDAIKNGQVDQFSWYKTGGSYSGGTASSTWSLSGLPGAGNYTGTSLAAQQVNGSTTGAINFAAPPGGKTRHIFAVGAGSDALTGPGGHTGVIIIYDRLLYYPGISHTTTSAQNLDNTNTLPRYTDGLGVMAWLEVTTALGSTAQNVTLTYTNDAGTSGQSTGAQAIITSASTPRFAHTFLFFPMAGTDKGIRSVQTVTFSAANSAGVSALVLGFPLAVVPLPDQGLYAERDLAVQIPSLPKLEDNHALGIIRWFGGSVNTALTQGLIQTAWN